MRPTQAIAAEQSGADTSRSSAALRWFVALQKGNPGARSRLRRARSRTEALLEPAAIQLAQRLGILSSRSSPDDSRLEAALGLARVLAHVKEHDGARRVMQAAGWKSFPNDRKESEAGNDRPIVSEVRFRRLLTTEPGEPLVQAFIRLVRQLDSQVNVTELASDFLALSDPAKRQRVRTKWAFDYFAAGVAAPAVSEIPSDDEDEP